MKGLVRRDGVGKYMEVRNDTKHGNGCLFDFFYL